MIKEKNLTSLIIARFEHALEQTMNRYTKLRRSILILDLIFLKSDLTFRIYLGTCLPAPVSEKKVLKESSPAADLSEGSIPSGCRPCSRQYSSQQALPIWTPAWPTWTEMHSLILIISFQAVFKTKEKTTYNLKYIHKWLKITGTC